MAAAVVVSAAVVVVGDDVAAVVEVVEDDPVLSTRNEQKGFSKHISILLVISLISINILT